MNEDKVMLPEVQVSPHSQLIEKAVSGNASVEVIEKLMQLQFNWEANQAKKAFVIAKNEFLKIVPQIIKTGAAGFDSKDKRSRTEYTYAELGKVLAQIKDALIQCGLTVSWKRGQSDGTNISIKCELTHELGHTEDSGWFEAGPDATGNKNSVQAIGSTTTYLERYSLFSLLGLAATDKDDDGDGADPPEYISKKDVDLVVKMLEDRNIKHQMFQKWLAMNKVKDGKIENIPVDMLKKVHDRITKKDEDGK